MRTREQRRMAGVGLSLAVCVGLATSAHAQFEFETIALSGQPVPGIAGVSYAGMLPFGPVMTDTGRVTFWSLLDGSPADNAMLSGPNSASLVKIGRGGESPIGLPPGVSLYAFDTFHNMNDSGVFASRAQLQGTGVTTSNDEVLLVGTNSTNLSVLAREGDPAPAGATGNFLVVVGPRMNNSGKTVFAARTGLTIAGSQQGIWTGSSNANLTKVLLGGEQAAGQVAGQVWSGTGQNRINDNGRIATIASTVGTGITGSSDIGIWTGSDASDLTTFVREGNVAPGTGGQTFASFSTLSLNNSNRIAFAGTTSSGDRGIWVGTSLGDLTALALEGNPAPGTTEDFSGLFAPTMNDNGRVLFATSTSFGHGLWTGTSSADLELLVHQEQAVDGVEPDVYFNDISDFILNNRDEVAFFGLLSSHGETVISDLNDRGIFVYDPTSEDGVKLLVREGNLLEIAPGDLRTIDDLFFVGGGNNGLDGLANGLNDQGFVSFAASFTDGSSGVFIAGISDSTAHLLGDADLDGDVDLSDLSVLATQYGRATGATWFQGDFDKDGDIDLNDLSSLATNYGAGESQAIADFHAIVPEPNSIATLAIAGLFLLKQRARRCRR